MADQITSLIRSPGFHIRAVLLALCDDCYTRLKATKHLAALQRADTPVNQLKRKTLHDIFICVHCSVPFSYQYNTPGNCHYQPKPCELDRGADCWEDTDDAHFDGIDGDEDMMEQFPEGWNHYCCGGIYGSKPCVVGTHVAHPAWAQGTDSSKAGIASASGVIFNEEDDEEGSEEGTEEEEEEEEEEDGHGDEDEDYERPSKK